MDYDIGEAFQRIEDEMIASMSRNLKRHLSKEKEEGLNYSMWQAEQLKALNEFKKNNAEAFKDYFGIVNEQFGEILKKCNQSGQLEQEAKILEAIQEGWDAPSVSTKGIQGSFFKINERKMNALINATKKDMAKAETAMLRQANDVYRKTIYNAQVYYNTGAGTLSQCVDMATKDFLAKGITCVEYANGAMVGIDVYSRMALRTAQTRAYLMGEAVKRDEWGINTVITNKRGAACPRCMQWVGRVFYDDVWGNLPIPSPEKYPRISTAIKGGLYHPNCKDIHTTYFEGISTPPKPMTKAQKDEANRVYNLEQRQRYNERQIRKYKRLVQGSVDPENVVKYRQKLKQWQDHQKAFIEENGDVLKRRAELEKIFELPENLQWGQNTYDFSQDNSDIINSTNIEHDHTWVEVIITPPTCEEKGEKIKKCAICDEEGEKIEIPPIGHKWVEVSVTPPTCTQKGERLLRCENCGEEKTEEIPATGHQFGTPYIVAPTCTQEGYTFKKCTVCGHIEKYDIKPVLGHDWGDWVITRQPTTALVGRKQAVCKRCGAKKYGTVPKLKAPSPAQQIKALEDSINQLDADIAALNQTSYTGIWKDVVTPSDYPYKKAGIPGKKQYFLDKIAVGDTSKDWQQFLDLVDEFEAKGQEYETLLAQRKNNQDALDLLKPNDAFSQSRKDAAKWFDKQHGGFSAADKYFDPPALKIHNAATAKERDGFYTYTSGSGGHNRPLAGFQKPWTKSGTGWEDQFYVGPKKVWIDYEGKGDQIRGLTTLIEKSTYPDDVWLQSGQGFATIEGFLGIKKDTLRYMTDSQLQQFVNRDGRIMNFISTAVNEGGGSMFNSKPLKINFYAPKGSQMLYASDKGAYGKGENEMILQRGGFYRIKKIYWGNDATDYNTRKIFVDMEIHPEKGYDLFQQDPNEWKGSKKNYQNP